MSADARDETSIRWNHAAPDPAPALDAVVAHAAELARMDGDVRRVRVSSAAGTVELELGGTPPEPAPAASADRPGTDKAAATTAGPDDDVHLLLSPMVGTFHRSPEPGADAFVSVGDVVEPGQQVGIVEAMKLMNVLETELGGRVLEILVDDGGTVEYGQPLIAFGVDVQS